MFFQEDDGIFLSGVWYDQGGNRLIEWQVLGGFFIQSGRDDFIADGDVGSECGAAWLGKKQAYGGLAGEMGGFGSEYRGDWLVDTEKYLWLVRWSLSFEKDLVIEDDQVDTTLESFVDKGSVLGFGLHEVFGEGGGGGGVEEDEVGGLTFGDGGHIE